MPEIARILKIVEPGTTPHRVENWLKAAGISLRSKSEAIKLRLRKRTPQELAQYKADCRERTLELVKQGKHVKFVNPEALHKSILNAQRIKVKKLRQARRKRAKEVEQTTNLVEPQVKQEEIIEESECIARPEPKKRAWLDALPQHTHSKKPEDV